MLLSSLYAFKDTVATTGDTEVLQIEADAGFVSDVLDLVDDDIADGGGELFLNVHCIEVDGSLAADVNITLNLEGSEAGTTFQTFATKLYNTSVGNADHTAIAVGPCMKVPLAPGLPRYLRVSGTPAATITNGVAFKAFISTS